MNRLLLLWRINPKSHKTAFRVVRPIGDWKWGDRAQTDLEFFLPETERICRLCSSIRAIKISS